MKKNKSFLRFRRGLTLVELSVVVLILGAIIALVAFNIKPGELKDQTAVLKLKKDSSLIPTYLSMYEDRYGKIPSEEQGLMALVEKPTTGEVPDNYRPIVKNKSDILDPWNTPYQLRIDNNGDYQIITLGKDKKEGGEGKNADFDILTDDEYPADFQRN
ncbi:MAG: type II secretion system protein GspG [Leptospiraceae bacterium]|nr:type II secretion system protein GspG [Leptospiraceae bacterium]MCP5511758.1 type II secretion system protein GspG [Leptospiraceae bacterium]